MSTILLSVKPEYAERILKGIKRFEYRRHLPREIIENIVIYSTSPQKRVVAKVEVIGVISESPQVVWEITKEYSGISYARYVEYFRNHNIAFAFQLGEIELFTPPKGLAEYRIKNPPQSFMYLAD